MIAIITLFRVALMLLAGIAFGGALVVAGLLVVAAVVPRRTWDDEEWMDW